MEPKGEQLLRPIKYRNSNLELYRIICMLMIVAHHYVVNSGITNDGGPLTSNLFSGNSIFLIFFGAWGKTGINCFLMITGYFMCTSRITFRKFLKLLGQVYLYKWLIYIIFLLMGYETLSKLSVLKLFMPVWGFNNNFVSCFIGFWLTIPFLNILVHNLTKREHELLLLLMLSFYTLLGSLPYFEVTFNYVTWFAIIYFIASYIRLYPADVFESKHIWGLMTFISMVLAMLSIIGMWLAFGRHGLSKGYFFVSDSNKLFALVVSVCSFLWFKNMNIKYNKIINNFGAGTFGVLLIHANSDAMRTWLWNDFFDVVGHSTLPFGSLLLFSFGVVLLIFVVCNLIDQLRIFTFEKWFLGWYDRKISAKAEYLLSRIIS